MHSVLRVINSKVYFNAKKIPIKFTWLVFPILKETFYILYAPSVCELSSNGEKKEGQMVLNPSFQVSSVDRTRSCSPISYKRLWIERDVV